jgi:hypothetical protein
MHNHSNLIIYNYQGKGKGEGKVQPRIGHEDPETE